MAITFVVNGESHALDVDPQTPLLWVIRDFIKLTGTKYGCGRGLCGACTVHVDGQPTRSCLMTVGAVAGKSVDTIESLEDSNPDLVDVWVNNNVAQCGYCQPGQLMSAAALLRDNPKPTNADIDGAMSGNICRCGTYTRIRQAIQDVAGQRT